MKVNTSGAKKARKNKVVNMNKETLFNRRKRRTRAKLRSRSSMRPRLSVFRSSNHIYAQVIDDRLGQTVVSASSLDKALVDTVKGGGNKEAASHVGKLLAERAVGLGVKEVIFDRGGYHFHGRVKALADGAREGGLLF